MRPSIFTRLYSYRPREARYAEEDFFTEAFVGVMEREPWLLSSVFRWLTGKDIERVSIRTQATYESVGESAGFDRPDMSLVGTDSDGNSHLLMIESKLGSAEGDNQLAGYLSVIRTMHAESRTLAYITKYHDEKSIQDISVKFVQRRWADVYRFIKKAINKEAPATTLVHELLTFMEQSKMNAEISPLELIAGLQFASAIPRFRDMLERAWTLSELDATFQEHVAQSGRWMPTPVSPGDLNQWSPSFRESRIQMVYGLHFDSSEPGPLMLSVQDTEMPILFVALYRYDGANPIFDVHKEYLESLASKRWILGTKFAPGTSWVGRKEILLTEVDISNLSESLASRLAHTMAELRDAPFFR